MEYLNKHSTHPNKIFYFINAYRCKWAIVGGTKYVVECVVIMSLDYGICNFGLVDKILVVEDTVIFQCKKLKIIKYDDHLKSYQVSLSEDLQYISQKKLGDFHPLSLNEGFGVNSCKNYDTLRYKVDCI